MSACELIRHCANSRTQTPVAAINTNIVFRTLSLSDFIVAPSSHQVLRVPLRSHRALSEQPRDFASPNFPDVFPVFCARLLLPAYSQIDTVAQSNPTTRGLLILLPRDWIPLARTDLDLDVLVRWRWCHQRDPLRERAPAPGDRRRRV